MNKLDIVKNKIRKISNLRELLKFGFEYFELTRVKQKTCRGIYINRKEGIVIKNMSEMTCSGYTPKFNAIPYREVSVAGTTVIIQPLCDRLQTPACKRKIQKFLYEKGKHCVDAHADNVMFYGKRLFFIDW